MNSRALMVWSSLVVAAVEVLIPGCAGDREPREAVAVQPDGEEAEKPDGPPPLMVDKTTPLLLKAPNERDEDSQKEATGPLADNGPCLVCHENYKEEPLVVWHAEQCTGCTDCHGDSYAHRNDENNTTPPDTMYPASLVNQSCEQCHMSHNVSAKEVIARMQERDLQETDTEKIVCTDCHGEHRLKIRTVRWDKNTGKLIVPDKD